MKEEWKPVPGYEALYDVSSLGNIMNLKSGKLVSSRDNGHGYFQSVLNKHGKRQMVYVHRIVAMAFVDNPHNLIQVNHIDFNRRNNNANNLEWVTPYENIVHSFSNPKRKNGKNSKTNTGERYISKRVYKTGLVCFKVDFVDEHGKRYAHTFRTIEAAIVARDAEINRKEA